MDFRPHQGHIVVCNVVYNENLLYAHTLSHCHPELSAAKNPYLYDVVSYNKQGHVYSSFLHKPEILWLDIAKTEWHYV